MDSISYFTRLLLLLSFMLGCQSVAQQPQRIVSLNLCTDLLLLQLTDKKNIASLSYLAADPAYSYLAHEAEGIPLNRGQAEEVLALNPDLILSSQFSASMAVNLLEQLGHNVTVLGFPGNLDETYAQIRLIATLVSEPKRGEQLIANMQDAIAQAQARIPAGMASKLAVFYSSNGYSYGSNTLRNSFINTLGLRNLASEAGISGSGKLSLEDLLNGKPDYLLVDSAHKHDNMLAHPMLKHPALKQSFSAENIITIPDRVFQCAGPSIVEAFEIMAMRAEN